MIKKLVLSLVGVCASFSVWAQQGPVHSAITYRIKLDRVTEWQDLRRQVVEIYQKAGVEFAQRAYVRQSGPYEIVIVRRFEKWEDLTPVPLQQNPKLKESAAQLTALNNRMWGCVESMSRELGRISDLSYGMSEEPAPMIRVLRTTVKPGHAAAYRNLIKSEVMPAYKKAGIKTFVHITPAYGAGAEVSAIPMSWKDIDAGNPLTKALGQQAFDALLTKLDAHIERRDADLYNYAPRLSYTPAAQASSGTR